MSVPNQPVLSRRSFLSLCSLGFVSLTLPLAGCGSQAGASEQSSVSDTATNQVRIGTLGISGRLHESGIIAQKQGFVDDELQKIGFSPSYTPYAQAGPAVNEAFASSEVDATIYSDMVSVTAASKQLPVKVVASSNFRYEYGILAGSASGAASLEDLKGKRIVAAFGTSAYQYLLKSLQAVGLGLGDIQIVNGTPNDAPNIVASGDAEALALPLTQSYTFEEKGIGTVIATSIGDDTLSSTHALAVRTDYADTHPEVVEALIRSLQRAYEFAKGNPDAAYQDLTDETYSLDTVRKVYPDTSFPSLNPQITDVVKHKYEDLLAFMKNNQLVDSSATIDSLFDTSYYDKAVSA